MRPHLQAQFERDRFSGAAGICAGTECDAMRARLAELVAAFEPDSPDNWLQSAPDMTFRGF